jgi:hypothetical protein
MIHQLTEQERLARILAEQQRGTFVLALLEEPTPALVPELYLRQLGW